MAFNRDTSMRYVPVAGDFVDVDDAVQGSADNYTTLRNGGRTSILVGLEAIMLAIADADSIKAHDSSIFIVQVWDGYNFEFRNYDFSDSAKTQAILDRFTEWQYDTWRGVPNNADVLAFINDNDFPTVFYDRSHDTVLDRSEDSDGIPFIVQALRDNTDSPNDFANVQIVRNGVPIGTKDRSNLLNGDWATVAIKVLCIQMARSIALLPNRVTRFQFDSEVFPAISDYDTSEGPPTLEQADVLADADGIITNPDTLTHFHEFTGGPTTSVIDESNQELQELVWADDRASFNVIHERVSAIAKGVWPTIEITTDPLFTPRQFNDLDAVQHWTSVTYAPAHPFRIAEKVKEAFARNRVNNQTSRVMVGPQLSNLIPLPEFPDDNPPDWGDGTTESRATPPDIYSEAIWCAIANGVQGIVGFGVTDLFETNEVANDGELKTDDMSIELWARLKELKDPTSVTSHSRYLYDPLNSLLTTWTPKANRTAILFSRSNYLFSSGAGATYSGQGTSEDPYTWAVPPIAGNRRHADDHAYENVFRALMKTGEPFDAIWDDDIIDGRLDDYKCVVIPNLWWVRRDVFDALEAYVAAGNIVITHLGSVLETDMSADNIALLRILDENYHDESSPLTSVAPAYFIPFITFASGGLDAARYETFLTALASDIVVNMSPLVPRVLVTSVANPTREFEVTTNIMTADSVDYLIVVNNKRTDGEESNWYFDQGTGRIGTGPEAELGVSIRKTQDLGVDQIVTIDWGGFDLTDVITGQEYLAPVSLTLLGGGGVVLRRTNPHGSFVDPFRKSMGWLSESIQSSSSSSSISTSSSSQSSSSSSTGIIEVPVGKELDKVGASSSSIDSTGASSATSDSVGPVSSTLTNPTS